MLCELTLYQKKPDPLLGHLVADALAKQGINASYCAIGLRTLLPESTVRVQEQWTSKGPRAHPREDLRLSFRDGTTVSYGYCSSIMLSAAVQLIKAYVANNGFSPA